MLASGNSRGVPPLTGDTSSYPTPSAFGRFQVLHQIGAGVLGPVFLARNAERQSFAIKVFRLDITPEQAGELTAQLSALARTTLSHPSIVAPVLAGVEGTSCYLVQEYVGAESLDAAIRQYGPAPLPQALRILTNVAAAIDFAAAAGVLHGALHPRDLLVTADEVKLTGFGIASALETIGLRAPVRRPYTAPERIERESWDNRADIYSLGVLAREMLVGRAKPGEKEVPRASEQQAALIEPMLARATAARREDRYGTALELVSALQQALTGAVAPAAPAPVRRPSASRAAAQPRGSDARLPLDEETPAEPGAAALGPAAALGLERHSDLSEKLADRQRDELTDFTFQHAPGDVPDASDRFTSGLDLGSLDAELGRDGIVREPEHVEDEARFSDVPGIVAEAQPSAGHGDELFSPETLDKTEREQPTPEALRQPLLTSPVASEPARSFRILPFAAVFVLGIVLGVVLGYFWGASPARSSPAQTTSQTPQTATQSQPATTGADQSPAAPSPTATPAAVPPAPVTGAPAAASRGDVPAARPTEEATKPTARPAPARAKANGRLTVRSTPRGASVAINGRSRGVTPLRLGSLAPGRYTVRVSRRGYATEERDVVLSADRPTAALSFAMTRGSRAERTSRGGFLGTVVVDSTPPGSQVFVDGKLVGQTPCTVPNVPAGSHVVRVDLIGFKRWAQAVEVRSGQRLRVTAALERDSR